MEVGILVFDGFDELDAIGPYEVLARASELGADLRVRLLTLEPAETVTASFGLRIEPHGVVDEALDLVIVPGGGWIDRADQGAWEEAQRGRLPQTLARLHAEGTTVASVCTGAMLLATAGLTRDRAATTHHGALDDLRRAGAEVLTARVVDDGDLVTAGGVTAGIDLALWLVEREWGAGLVERIAEEMEYERHHAVHVVDPEGARRFRTRKGPLSRP